MKTDTLISDALAAFVAQARWSDIPASVRHRAKLLMLDAVGNAYASAGSEFAHKALAALSGLGRGDGVVIGMPERLALRDAVLMNGMLVHGLDYDDTYLPGSVHLTASCVPAALGMAAHARASGKELLVACLLGLEVAARLGAAGNGGFVKSGFHATSVLGTFACALVAGRVMQLNAAQLALAQGIALSTAAGNLQPMQDGSWTKRMHPGWSGVCGITAASLAQQGFIGPSQAYEGRFGLFPCFLGQHAGVADTSLVTSDLGQRWEFMRTSIKLYPACHQLHAFMNAATALAREHAFEVSQIESVRALITEAAVQLVCEPADAKRKPVSSYAAQFSLPYSIAASLARGRFGLQEIEASAYTDPQLLALAQKVAYEIDPRAGFPKYRSGEVVVRLQDGRVLSQRENIFPDEPAAEDAIVQKFSDNTRAPLGATRSADVRDAIMNIEDVADARTLAGLLAGAPRGAGGEAAAAAPVLTA